MSQVFDIEFQSILRTSRGLGLSTLNWKGIEKPLSVSSMFMSFHAARVGDSTGWDGFRTTKCDEVQRFDVGCQKKMIR